MALEPLISSLNFFLRSPYPIFNSSLLESSILARDFWLFVRKLKKNVSHPLVPSGWCSLPSDVLEAFSVSAYRFGPPSCLLRGSSIPSCWARSHCPTGPRLLPCSSCLALPDIFPPTPLNSSFWVQLQLFWPLLPPFSISQEALSAAVPFLSTQGGTTKLCQILTNTPKNIILLLAPLADAPGSSKDETDIGLPELLHKNKNWARLQGTTVSCVTYFS